MEPLLDGQIAVVTGAAHGIGRATAALFAEHGATAVIADVDEAAAAEAVDEIVAAGGNAEAITTDVRVDADVERLRERRARHARSDRRAREQRRALSARPALRQERTRRCGRSCTRSTCSTSSGSRMRSCRRCSSSRRGAIVNVSSVEGVRGYPPDPVYGAFKAAVIHFTKCLAVDVAGRGVRVNGVGPDLTQSQQVDYETLDTGGRNLWPIWAPLGRRGEPEDQARAILFLASDLSEFIVGQTLLTDGGSGAAGGWFRTDATRRSTLDEPTDRSLIRNRGSARVAPVTLPSCRRAAPVWRRRGRRGARSR